METIDEVGKDTLLKIYQPFEKVYDNKWHIEEKRKVECPNTEFDLNTSLYWSEKEDGYIVEKNFCKAYIWDTKTGRVQLGCDEEGSFDEKGISVLKLMIRSVFLTETFFKKGLCPSHIVIVNMQSKSCYLDECSNTDEQVSIYCFSQKNKKEILKNYNLQ